MTMQELFSSLDRWVQNDFARDEFGREVESWDEDATSWCLMGGIEKCYGVNNLAFFLTYNKIRRDVGILSHYNDDPKRTFEDIQNLCKKLNI